ncbi:hypothetical protein, partial [uncultured Holdemanella sp.]|uniref:hypothetical protein n=1 Tax=uncultured Holdemanella sp. TaxID=1763549 RepID=UPI00258A6F22
NAVQHPYNKIKRKFDIKKALHKRHLEYLRFYNCRTTAFLENNLQEDGSILIPEALQPYMGGKKKIG